MLYAVLACAFLTIFILCITLHHLLTAKGRRMASRLKLYTSVQEAGEAKKEAKGKGPRGKAGKNPKKGRLASGTYYKKVEEGLVRAALPLRVNEFVAGQFLSAILCALVSYLLLRNLYFAILLGVPGFYLPFLYMRGRQRARVKKFDSQIADSLVLISNSLKAGYSFIQAMEMVAKEMPVPISEEFGRAIKEMNLGFPTEESLLGINERIGSEDVDLVMTAVLTQRQIGGNLSEILDTISHTIRERVRIKGEIRTLTAQGRISGFIIGGLPFVVALILLVINPTYLIVLVQQPIGWLMIGGAILSQMMGVFLIRKIIRIEV